MNFTITILSQHEFKQHLQESFTSHGTVQTAAGKLYLSATEKGIYQAFFSDNLSFEEEKKFSSTLDITKILLVGTNFQLKVWQATLHIPLGSTVSYQNLAQGIGHAHAWRAVANALGQNKLAYIIPCHRIVQKNGSLGGYKWGLDKKRVLLQAESIRNF